jgi:hypothetical protein
VERGFRFELASCDSSPRPEAILEAGSSCDSKSSSGGGLSSRAESRVKGGFGNAFPGPDISFIGIYLAQMLLA